MKSPSRSSSEGAQGLVSLPKICELFRKYTLKSNLNLFEDYQRRRERIRKQAEKDAMEELESDEELDGSEDEDSQ